ncbi:MAG: MMPL family transporter [Minwuia sp.]|uniref:MMPL family transporter n=1 Tax=Minwuia sp. TaxID=2493630 RepID=UPI003A8AF55D
MQDQPATVTGLPARIAVWSARRRWLTVALVLMMTVLSGVYAARQLSINTDTLDMISPETPFRRANLDFRAAFPWYGNQIAIVIDAPAPELAELAARDLAERLESRPERFEHVQATGIDPYLRRQGLMFMPPERLQDLLDRLAAAQGLLAVLAERPDLTGLLDMLELALAEADPESVQTAQLTELVATLADMAENDPDAPRVLSWRRQLAVEGQRGLDGRQIVVAKPVQDYASLSPAKAAIGDLRTIFADHGIEGVSYRLTGNAALNTEELESVKLGGSTAGIVSGIGILLLLIIGLRGIRPVLATLAVLVSGLVISLGFATLAVGQLNLLSVAFAVLFIGLAVDFSIHFSLRFREATGEDGDPVRRTAASVGGSLTLSALAAAIGFLAFLPTDYLGLAELGIIAAGSMVIALALNLTLLPALLTGAAPTGATVAAQPSRFDSRSMPARPLVFAGIILAVAGLATAPLVRFDSDPVNLKDPASESVQAYRDLESAENRSVHAIDGLVSADTDMTAVEDRLKLVSRGGRVVYLEKFIPDDQDQKLAALENAALFLFPVLMAQPAEPPSAEARRAAIESFTATVGDTSPSPLQSEASRLASALTALDDPGLDRLEGRATGLLGPWLDDLRLAFEAGPVTEADLPDSLRTQWIAEDGRRRIEVFPGAPFSSDWTMTDYAEATQAAMPSATGAPVMVTFAGEAVRGSFQEAAIIAAVLVLLLMGAVLRRIDDVLLCAAPVAMAALSTFAAAWALGIQLNFANVIVLPLLFGLGVASSVHLVMRRRGTGDAASLMRTSTPRAVLFSSLTTLASFGSLALSQHMGMASMGMLLTIAILSILFYTLIWTPALIRLIDRRNTPM